VYYLIYLSERCNLSCVYCETPSTRGRLTQDAAWDVGALSEFLSQDDDLALWFFGGEPHRRIDLIEARLARLEPAHVIVQTNGLLLDRIPDALLPQISVMAVSLDGPRDLTDRHRGAGTYDSAIAQAQALRARGYTGRLDVRLTVNPGVDAERAVSHFLGDCDLEFDAIHWQLNALFDDRFWRESERQIRRWLTDLYNPQVSRLIDAWAAELARGRLRQIVPFARVMHTLLTGQLLNRPQCGAGCAMWTITTDGDVYPCPVLRSLPRYNMGPFSELTPSTLRSSVALGEPCTSCRVFDICGGRCLYANVENEWDEDGFRLVCATVEHLIAELERVKPAAEEAIARGHVNIGDFARCREYEVIP
jgi:uncharacterized protein